MSRFTLMSLRGMNLASWSRSLAAIAVALVALAFGNQALADKIHVESFKGPQAKPMQKAVEQAVKRAGHKVVRAKAADAVISGTVSKKGKKFTLELTVSDSSGSSLDSFEFTGRKPPQLKRAINKRMKRNLKGALAKLDKSDKTEVASSDEKKDNEEDKSNWRRDEEESAAGDEEDTQVADSSKSSASSGDGMSVSMKAGDKEGGMGINVSAGLKLYSRSLSYNDDLFERVNEYSVPAAPEFLVRGSYDVLDFLRVGAGFGFTSSFDSKDSAGDAFPTSGYSLNLGARYLYSVAGIDLGAGADFGLRKFAIDNAGDVEKPEIPSVNYSYLRAAVDARYPLMKKLDLLGSLGYRFVLGAGEIESQMYFPRSSVGGVDLGLGAEYAISSSLSVSAGVDLERYFYSLNPEPGDPWIAGGAIDQYFGGWLAASMRL